MWKIKYEWLKPGVREREIEAKVHEFMLERGCEIIYDIIVASGGNTSPYRRWATDKLIRQGDLVIVDINAVGPSGYFIDFVRCFKCGGAQGMKMTPEGNRPLPRGLRFDVRRHRAAASPATPPRTSPSSSRNTTTTSTATVTLQQFAHSIGITLYEGMWMSRAYSMKYPAEIKENMYFAIETFAGHPNLEQTCRLEENVLVTAEGPGRLHAHGAHGRGDEAGNGAATSGRGRRLCFPNLDPARAVLSRDRRRAAAGAASSTPEAIMSVATRRRRACW